MKIFRNTDKNICKMTGFSNYFRECISTDGDLRDINAVEKLIIDELKTPGYDIIWIADENQYLDDVSIFKIAQKDDRILLTNDKDFGEIVFRQKLISSGIVLFRIKGQDTMKKIKLFKKVLISHKGRIPKHFVVITKKKGRFTPI